MLLKKRTDCLFVLVGFFAAETDTGMPRFDFSPEVRPLLFWYLIETWGAAGICGDVGFSTVDSAWIASFRSSRPCTANTVSHNFSEQIPIIWPSTSLDPEDNQNTLLACKMKIPKKFICFSYTRTSNKYSALFISLVAISIQIWRTSTNANETFLIMNTCYVTHLV